MREKSIFSTSVDVEGDSDFEKEKLTYLSIICGEVAALVIVVVVIAGLRQRRKGRMGYNSQYTEIGI